MLVYQRVPTVLGDSPWPMSSTYFVATLLFHWPADINGLQINDRGQKRQVFFGLKSSTGWWLTYPSEKYESQLGWLFPIYGKIKNVPNHQPVNDIWPCTSCTMVLGRNSRQRLRVCLGASSEIHWEVWHHQHQQQQHHHHQHHHHHPPHQHCQWSVSMIMISETHLLHILTYINQPLWWNNNKYI